MAKKTTRRKAPAAGERKARKPAVRKPASAGAAKTAIPGKATATQAAIQAPSSAREKQDAATAAPVPFPVVAVGASAGGLEAFTELLRALPPDTGMSFVFIQHLSHTSESLLPEILSKATAMPVAAVTDDVRAKPSHVYVIPPQCRSVVFPGIHQSPPPSRGSRAAYARRHLHALPRSGMHRESHRSDFVGNRL
jgi:chemotaxis response regulator CheB